MKKTIRRSVQLKQKAERSFKCFKNQLNNSLNRQIKKYKKGTK